MNLTQQIDAAIKELIQLRNANGAKDQIAELEQTIWEKSKEKFRRAIEVKLKNKEVKPYRGIIFTIGFSKEPIILNILGFRPDFCYFIHSRQSEKVIDSIIAETG
ncbi:MAG: hypothetical protein ACTSRL_20395, partial [Candidatus Helarchaeota archaeon]